LGAISSGLGRASSTALSVAAALLVLGIEAVDYLAGAQMDLTILQAAPVLAIAVLCGRARAVAVAAVGATAWLNVHLASGQIYAHALIPFWNAAAGFGFLAITVILLTRLRQDLLVRERLVARLEVALTERERAEQALERRTIELARSNEELEQYAHIAAHDLKSPLVAIGGFAQLLHRRLERTSDPDTDTFVEQIVQGVARMQALIEDLLAFAKAGGEIGEPEAVDCNAAFDLAFASLEAEVRDARTAIRRTNLPKVLARPGQVVQLFQNLLSNALKFHDEGAPAVHTSAECQGSEWVFAVRDNGVGISPEDSEKIFGLFQRLPGKTRAPGTGLGLAICKKIVERSGGRIWVESAAGSGSTFRFTLPMVPPSRVEPDTGKAVGASSVLPRGTVDA
jgi:signal transduction histidine kinase